ncbi:MAG: hypothetical protein ACP5VR_01550 [Acidimicrobiales bacterium]
MTSLRLGISATKAPWSGALRSYVRDHTLGISVEVLMDRAGLQRSVPRLDVVVIDDVMRLFSRSDIADARSKGAHVIGLYDLGSGMGREYLAELGADQLYPASTPAAELVEAVLSAGPRPAPGPWAREAERRPLATAAPRQRQRRGQLWVWAKASGGAGLSEAVVAAAEVLALRQKVLLVEAEEVAPVLASRLVRSGESGLSWAMSRAAQGLRALPEALSGARGDGSEPLGRFDVVCAASHPAQPIKLGYLLRLVEEALLSYDHVLVEAGWVFASPVRDGSAPPGPLLARADRVVVMGAADPEGAAKLVEWKAAALLHGVSAPCWAVFGRAPKGRYERGHLASLVESNTGKLPFAGICFLPEDPIVARARWNAEMVWKGPWQKAVSSLVSAVHKQVPGKGAAVVVDGRVPAARRRQLVGAVS